MEAGDTRLQVGACRSGHWSPGAGAVSADSCWGRSGGGVLNMGRRQVPILLCCCSGPGLSLSHPGAREGSLGHPGARERSGPAACGRWTPWAGQGCGAGMTVGSPLGCLSPGPLTGERRDFVSSFRSEPVGASRLQTRWSSWGLGETRRHPRARRAVRPRFSSLFMT